MGFGTLLTKVLMGIMGGTERLVCTQNGVLRPRLVHGVKEGP